MTEVPNVLSVATGIG